MTEKFTLALGIRQQEDRNLGQLRVRGTDIAEPFPWNNSGALASESPRLQRDLEQKVGDVVSRRRPHACRYSISGPTTS